MPALLGVSEFLQDTPIRVGEPSPRTVVAPDTIRVADPDATARAKREAAEAVAPVFLDDEDAKAAIVEQVSDVFARAAAAREAGGDERAPTRGEQIEALRDRLPMLDEEGLTLLVGLSDEQLARVAAESTQIAQQFARQSITEDSVTALADEELPTELVVRPFPDGVAEAVVDPVIRDALRPTVRLDESATAEARRQAANDVADVERSYLGGSVIVSAGEVVDSVQFAALQRRGLEGREPWGSLLRGLLLSTLLTVAVATYLRAYRPHVWRSGKRLLLLAVLAVMFAAALQGVVLTAPSSGWLYAVPAGAVTMLATILFDPPVGVLATVPLTALVAFTVPGEPGLAAFAAVAGLGSVPLVSRLSARGDLRRAAWQSTLGYTGLAGTFALIFSTPEGLPTAMAAGLLNGVMTAVILNGSLPFLESVFGVLTATSLLDLADRNHPLLRELEQKALGSYNHSIMVSTLVERAARRIGADSLLASVAALYHDIGKVARPYFFVENQYGIPNPHDGLDPAASAIIIQRHVTDGLEMARTYRLPAEVVEGIATHHGTTRVGYFYQQALNQASNGQEIDEQHFRYKGRKPSTKEMAILMLADCCEGASRAAALTNRNLSREDLADIVHNLVAERVDDGQLDEASLTFRELATVQDTFIETLVGVYHPRIAYPEPKGVGQAPAAGDDEAASDEAALADRAGTRTATEAALDDAATAER
ncbi:MAG TPA: HDIG domain-containing protein [Egibacteraceae bacterium]|nr:HDIG domain-containing protein [Egibacteraceae bacterium]